MALDLDQQPVATKTAVVFAPHPDDETLACGGTIAKRVRGGRDVYIVFMTDGRNSHLHRLGISADPAPEQLVQVRKEEARRAARILGVKLENLIFLDIEDGTLGLNKKIAKDKVSRVIMRLQPHEIYYPERDDLHRDHSSTYEVVEDALKALSIIPKRYRYLIWSDEGKVKDTVEQQIVVENISSVLAVKKQVIDEYQSQIALFSKKQSCPVLSVSFLAKFVTSQELFTTGPQD
jgi:LmbE family N-acetylglucosaminyl deacetylase